MLDPASAALRAEGRGEVDEISSEESEVDCEILEEDMFGEDLHLRDPGDVAGLSAAQEVSTQNSQTTTGVDRSWHCGHFGLCIFLKTFICCLKACCDVGCFLIV